MLYELIDPTSPNANMAMGAGLSVQFGLETFGYWAGGLALDVMTSVPPGTCHPASATLDLDDGRAVRIDSVRVGDKVRGPSGYTTVLGFLHAEDRAGVHPTGAARR